MEAHSELGVSITSALLAPANFHPHLLLGLHVPPRPPSTHLSSSSAGSAPGDCTLQVALTLPDELFLDPAELPDALSVSGAVRLSGWAVRPEVIDIERPVRRGPAGGGVDGGSAQLQEVVLDLAGKTEEGEEVRLDIPLHARYLRPNAQGFEDVQLLAGGQTGCVRAGWSCGSDTRVSESSCLPVGSLSLRLPTGRPEHQPFVELGTVAAMWLGFGWLAYKIVRLRRRATTGRASMPKAKVS